MRRPIWLLLAVAALAWWTWQQQSTPSADVARQGPVAEGPARTASSATAYPAFLPPEAHAVLDRIVRGQPHPYPQDGGIFGNRERLLPTQPRGYYREYTVPTPGERDRGARRIVTGGATRADAMPREFWYTADHYRSFRAFQLPPAPPHPSSHQPLSQTP